MIAQETYQKAFFAALFFHLLIGFFLLAESSNKPPVLKNEALNIPGQERPTTKAEAKSEVVKAVSVDNKAVMETVNRLREARAAEIRTEQARQQNLLKQADMAKKARVQEQERLTKLKEESIKLALARKKELAEEQKHLKDLAKQKELETKRLEEMRHQQQALLKKQAQETAKLAELKKKQASLDEHKKIEEAKNKAEAQKKAEQAAAQKAADTVAEQARMAGLVDKYKALIVNAIGQRWILPDQVDPNLSSQFQIRLAPDGTVLKVTLTRSSGDSVLDRSAQTAIYKASPLPVPSDPSTFNLFRDISLTVRPENIRG